MAKIRIPFNVTKDFDKQFAKVGEVIVKDLQKGFSSLRKDVGKGIDEAVEEHNDLLIPDDFDAGELGIGEDGRIDRNKTQNAWRQLLSKPPGLSAAERPTIFSVTKATSKTGIGTIRVTIDEEKLYNAPLSIVETDSDILERNFPRNIIPWLKWFIEGAEVSGFKFTDSARRNANLGASRTGKGIMIRGGMWDFPPGESPFPLIERAIEELLIETVERYIERQL